MSLVLASLIGLAVGALLLVVFPRAHFGFWLTLASSVLGFLGAAKSLASGEVVELSWAWTVPYGSLHLRLDPLAAWFLSLLFALVFATVIYGRAYWKDLPSGKLSAAWGFFCCLVLGMAVVLLAANAVLFLVSWEAMSLAAFFLVTLDSSETGFRAGWIYLVASHASVAFLLAFFLLLSGDSNVADFANLAAPNAAARHAAFALALLGFGLKAGLVPLHLWLPEAHPEAPSHVSSLMSGAMIKMGLYGILRTASLLGPPPSWWAWLILGAGAFSAVYGILHACGQRDLKRSFAYSSIENIGLMAMGVGLFSLGWLRESHALCLLGLVAALFHAASHGVAKGLMFMVAGTVAHHAGTRDLDRLGGLARSMPWTAGAAALGTLAMAGLPPMSGFVGEFLLLLGALEAASLPALRVVAPVVLAVVGFAAALAAVTFLRAFALAFAGEPRHAAPSHGERMGGLAFPPLLLAGLGVALSLGAPWLVLPLSSVARSLLGDGPWLPRLAVEAGLAASWLRWLAASCGAFLLLAIGASFALRRMLASRRTAAPTWDCGFLGANPRMQYTASSFTLPILRLFPQLFPLKERFQPPAGLFPKKARYAFTVADAVGDRLLPRLSGLPRVLGIFRLGPSGEVHLSVLFVALGLALLLLIGVLT